MVGKIKVGIVVPTYKVELWNKFKTAWDWNSEEYDLTLYCIEDQPKKSNLLGANKHYSWKEIDEDLKKDSHMIPRRSSGIRSYGYLKAYQDGMDYVLTLDDDCYPEDNKYNSIETFISYHLLAFNGRSEYSTFFNVGKFLYGDNLWMRGSPIRYRLPRNPVVSIGSWNHNPDLDAYTQLEKQTPNLKVGTIGCINVPKNLGLTMCGMNVMFSREVIPIAYFLLQSKELGVERCDDIWAGLFMKKVLDKFDKPMCINGYATVHHNRASNPLTSLIAEGGSVGYNETLWDKLLPIQLEGDTYLDCYEDLTNKLHIEWFPNDYLNILDTGMRTWIKQFQKQ